MANPRDTKGRDDQNGDNSARSVTGDLASRIARAKAEHAGPVVERDERSGGMQGMNRAFRQVSEFAAAIIVGGALGYGVDQLVGTRPWAMIILLLLGFIAGVVNVVRSTREMNAETAVPPGTPLVPDDDDDN